MTNLLMLPVVLPLVAACVAMLSRRSLTAQRWIGGLGAHALLLLAIYLTQRARTGDILTLPFSGWPDSFGIVFVLDVLAALMVLLSALIQTITFWFVLAGALPREMEERFFHPLFLILAAGVNWSFLTGDLFNLFVGFELILLCSYALLSLTGGAAGWREAYKFVVLNILAGTLFLAAAGLVYGTYGTLNLADLAIRVRETGTNPMGVALGTLLLIVFGTKAAIFPLFFWLPTAYPHLPLGILPYFTAMLTKVGVYCLYRVFTLVFAVDVEQWFQPLILAIAGSTMLIGVLAALSQWTMRRILSVHIVSQIGYMIFGLGLFTAAGFSGGLLSVFHNIVVKTALFLCAATVVLFYGTDRLKEVAGLMGRHPLLAILFLLSAFSLAGLPPLSGFYTKWVLTVEGIQTGHFFIVVVSIVTSLFTLASMVKIWTYSFWGETKGDPLPAPRAYRPAALAVTAALVTVSLLFVLFTPWVVEASEQAGAQLMEPMAYVEAVLGQPGGDALRLAMAAHENPLEVPAP